MLWYQLHRYAPLTTNLSIMAIAKCVRKHTRYVHHHLANIAVLNYRVMMATIYRRISMNGPIRMLKDSTSSTSALAVLEGISQRLIINDINQ
jgi:hypothetical protein